MRKSLLLAAVLFAGLAGGAEAQTVRIGTEGAYAPWNFVNEDGKLAGFEMDLGTALCEKAGITCEFVQNEWDTIIPNLVAGNYDAIMAGMSITDERKQTIDFSQDYYPPDPSRYAVAASSNIDWNKLTGLKIGVQGATIQAAYAQENLADGNQILSYETADQSMADLAAGNVDIVFADGGYLEPIVEGSAGALKLDGPDVMIGDGVGIGLRKTDTDLKDKFNTALDAAKADGSLDALIKKWFDKGPFYKM